MHIPSTLRCLRLFACLQLHMWHLQSTPEFKKVFPEVAGEANRDDSSAATGDSGGKTWRLRWNKGKQAEG